MDLAWAFITSKIMLVTLKYTRIMWIADIVGVSYCLRKYSWTHWRTSEQQKEKFSTCM